MDLLSFVRGCTFDDFLLTPQRGVLARRDPDTVDLAARFSEHLQLKRPIVSANMDTVHVPRWRSCLLKKAGLASSIADSGRVTSRRGRRDRRSSAPSTA